MRALKILILEDDMLYATDIEMSLTRLGYEVLPIQDKAEDALPKLNDWQADLIIADIYLNGQMTGIEFAHAIQPKKIPLILITSSEDMSVYEAAQGILPEAFLVKPFNPLSLQSAIERAFLRKGEPLLISQVMNQWNKGQVINQHLFVRRGTALVKLRVEDIVLIEADGNYCYLYEDKHKYAIKLSLRRIKEKLKQAFFLQVNRNFLVNFHFVEEVNFVENTIRVNQQNLTVGATYKEEIEGWMNRV